MSQSRAIPKIYIVQTGMLYERLGIEAAFETREAAEACLDALIAKFGKKHEKNADNADEGFTECSWYGEISDDFQCYACNSDVVSLEAVEFHRSYLSYKKSK